MRTTDVVLRLNGLQVPKLEIGNSDNYSAFYNALHQSINQHTADIVYKGDYFRLDRHLLPEDTNAYRTYALFREITLNDETDDAIWQQLKNEVDRLYFPEIRAENENHQLIELSILSDSNKGVLEETVSEDVLIRISGSREELEFDPISVEGNKILYDRLVRMVYDKEVEIMYKGPKLILEENSDLFINADEFSIYMLFRSPRSSEYDDNELLWSHLSDDLKVLSSITLMRSAKNYQVLLLTHDEHIFNDDDIQL